MVIKTKPEERLSVTGFPRPRERFSESDPKVYDPTIYESIVYKCHDCNEEITFQEKHFEKHSHSEFSNLSEEIQKEINDFVKLNGLKINSFLDFNCPKCTKPIRIYYTDGYGGKYGEYFVDIEFVLEIEKPNRITEP